MAKSQDAKKTVKKEPLKSMKEKITTQITFAIPAMPTLACWEPGIEPVPLSNKF